MKRKSVSGIMLTLLLIGMLTLAFRIQPVKASGTIYIRADGSVDPDTAPISTVDNVTYTFTDNIYDSLAVERNNIVVDGAGYTLQGPGVTGIYMSERRNVTIRNTRINDFYDGILLKYSSNNSIYGNNIANGLSGIPLPGSSNNSVYGNTITNEWYGIYLSESSNNSIFGNRITATDFEGIWLRYSSNNSINGNNVAYNDGTAISLQWSSNNNIAGNNITNNYYGIRLSDSSNNILRSNSMDNNKYNFMVYGVSLSDFVNDVDVSNTVDGNPVYYWINKQDMTVPPDTGYVALVNCTSITVENLNLVNNGQGLLLAFTTNSTITKNNITNNCYGICLYESTGNSIYGNTIANNFCGIYLEYSSNNSIYHNNFVDNTLFQVYSMGCANVWDNGYPSGGNYWSDHNPPDIYSGLNQDVSGSDGIGDIPYIIDENNIDRYPLVYPYGYVPSPDVNGDGIVDIRDIGICTKAFGAYPGDPRWKPQADLDKEHSPNLIDIYDLVTIAVNYGKTL